MKPGAAVRLWRSSPPDLGLPETTWAYLAGLLDGEGTISRPSVTFNSKGWRKRSGWRLAIAQRTDTGLCDWIGATVGYGTPTLHTQARKNDVSNWRCSAQMEVLDFLLRTEPYLRVKRAVAIEAINDIKGQA